MNNLYVFAVGGSGERVMRSLILTLASGVKAEVNQIIPVFVDNDEKSNALLKCLDLIKYYNSNPKTGGKMGANTVYQNVSNASDNWPSFFKTSISEPIILNKTGSAIGNLQTIIGSVDADRSIFSDIAEERDLLFTQDDLQMPLNVGFVGNPNIGSVVLNSLSLGDPSFGTISDSITADDGVIVIGSLFGGTGAAGFPLIINTFNAIDAARKPLLGGVAILPYFSIESKDKSTGIIDTTKWDVNSDSFDVKTRAALMYYDEYMRDMDYLYYVGDGSSKDVYEHYVGGEKQENPAHIVELMSALSIIDFSNVKEHPTSVVYKSPVWGFNEAGGDRIPTNFSGIRNSNLGKALAKFEMMKQIFTNDNFLKWAIAENKNYVRNIGFTEAMRLSVCNKDKVDTFEYSWGVNYLIQEWIEWVEQLGRAGAKRKFLFYNETSEATDSDITSKFYANTNNGIAKITTKKKYPFFTPENVPVSANVAEFLEAAYKKIYPKGRPEDAQKIDDAKKLPIMLQIISDALDNIIRNNCISI